VKLLLNMNVLPQLMSGLVAAGHSCRHSRDIGLARAEDPEIITAARAAGEVIITHDLDYGHLLAFSGEANPSVIILRVRNTHPDALGRRLTECWPDIDDALRRGAIVTVEDAAVRIRLLPIVRDE
jgi:predicted nuclease of predicted toxin-antitoxin system